MRPLPPDWFVHSRLKLRHLQLLAALARYQKLHLAAESMFMSQPAASKLLIDLEVVVGRSLFTRKGRLLEPNESGEILTRRAQAVLAELDATREELNTVGDGQHGRIVLGAIDAPMVSVLTRAIAAAQAKYPRIEIEIQEEPSVVLLDRMLNGHIDFALGRLVPEVDPARFRYTELGQEGLCVIARKGHPLSREEVIGITQLRNQLWILQARGSALRRRVEHLFLEGGLPPPDQIVSTNSLLMTLSYVAQGNAISVISEPVARQQEAYGQIVVLPVSAMTQADGYGLILPTQRRLSPAATTILETVRVAFQAVATVSS